MPPCKDKIVQIDTGPVTNHTVCHYQVVCSKPCNCSFGAKPMSIENLVEPNFASMSYKPCNCSVSSRPMNLETPVDLNLTPKSNNTCKCTVSAKPMSLETPVDPKLSSSSKKPYNYSADTNKPMSLESPVDPNPIPKSNNTFTDDSSNSKEQDKRSKDKKKTKIICGCYSEDKKKKRNKSRNIICECNPKTEIVSIDKSVTTYADESVSCNPADGRETQTNKTEDITSQCDVDVKPLRKSPLKTVWIDKGCNSDCSTCDDERTGDVVSEKKYTRRDRGSKYKRSKPNKCDCGCCDCDSSVDCGTASEVETVGYKGAL